MIGKRVKCPLCNNIFVARLPGADPTQPTAYNLTSQPEIPPASRKPDPPAQSEPERQRERGNDTERGRGWSSRQETHQDDEEDDSRRRDRRERDRPREQDRKGQSHRGSQILTLSIIGLFCFGVILGPIALGMAVSDLNSMARGQMDRSGEGSTRAGMIIGILATVLHLLCCGIGMLWIIAAVA